jgi:O-antigen/teichoic acid export membrane protein
MATLPQRFKRNVLSNYGGAAVSLLIALGVTPILVRGLGKEAYGVWGLATSAIAYFGLLQLGFGRAAVRHIAADHERGDTDRLQAVIATSAFSLLIPGAFVLLISPGLAFLFPVVFHVPHSLVVPAMVLVALSAIDLACSIPSDTFGATLIGLQRYDLLNVTVASTSIAQAAGWVVVIALGGGLIPLGVSMLAFSLAGQASRYLFAHRILQIDVLKPRFFDRKLVRPLLSMSGWIAVNEVSDTIVGEIDAIVVGIVVGVPEAAIYIVGQKLARLVGSFTFPVQGMFYPHAARLAAAGDREGLRNTVFAGTRISIAVATPLMLVLAVLAKPALNAWVGPGYDSAAPVIIYLSGVVVVSTISRTLVYVLRGMGDVKVPALCGLFEAGLNLPLSIGLGLTIGFQGVALASLIAVAIANFAFMLPYACRKTEISMVGLLLVVVRANLPAAIAATGVGLLLLNQNLSGILEVIGAGVAMLIAYGLVLFVTGLSDDERNRVTGMLRQRLRHA